MSECAQYCKRDKNQNAKAVKVRLLGALSLTALPGRDSDGLFMAVYSRSRRLCFRGQLHPCRGYQYCIAPQMVTLALSEWRRLAATAAHGQLSISLRGRGHLRGWTYHVISAVRRSVLRASSSQIRLSVSRIAFFSHQVPSEHHGPSRFGASMGMGSIGRGAAMSPSSA